MYKIVVSASPAVVPGEGRAAIQVSKKPDAVTVTVPAKKECEIVFVPLSSVIAIDEPEGLHAKIVMTVKKDKEVQTLTYYMSEEPEQGGDNSHDPPLRPAFNPYWLLQRIVPANMRQQTISVPLNHSFTLPKEFKTSQSGKGMTVPVELPSCTNARSLNRGEVFILE